MIKEKIKIYSKIKDETYKFSIIPDKTIELNAILLNIPENKIKEGQKTFINSVIRINNIKYDILNIKNYSMKLKPYNYLLKIKDTQQYTFIKKKPLKDISTKNILKELFLLHKINSFEYKKSIKKVNSGLKLSKKVTENINFYLKNIKRNKENKHITKKRKDNNFFNIEINKINYKIALKKGIDSDKHENNIKKECFIRFENFNKYLFDNN